MEGPWIVSWMAYDVRWTIQSARRWKTRRRQQPDKLVSDHRIFLNAGHESPMLPMGSDKQLINGRRSQKISP
jgi:hypothetical protein